MPKGQNEGQSGQVVQKSAAARFSDKLELEATFTENSTEKVVENVVSNMLQAETLEEAFALQDKSLPSGKDMVGVEHIVLDFEVVKGEERFAEHGLGYYMRVRAARLDTGEEITYTVGAPNVVTLLWKAREHERLPIEVVITSRETANGELLMLKPVPKRATRS